LGDYFFSDAADVSPTPPPPLLPLTCDPINPRRATNAIHTFSLNNVSKDAACACLKEAQSEKILH
jgi:hypothetical protein